MHAVSSVAGAASAPDPRSSALYKTELCRSFIEQGRCRYAFKCRFAHGVEDLRPVARHKKYKTERCKNFQVTGQCPYGPRCRFIHDDQEAKLARLLNIAAHAQAQPGAVPAITPPELQAALDANPSLTSVITTGHSAGLRLDDNKVDGGVAESMDPAGNQILKRVESGSAADGQPRNGAGSQHPVTAPLPPLEQAHSRRDSPPQLQHHSSQPAVLSGSGPQHHLMHGGPQQQQQQQQQQQHQAQMATGSGGQAYGPGVARMRPTGRAHHQRLHSFSSMRSLASNASVNSGAPHDQQGSHHGQELVDHELAAGSEYGMDFVHGDRQQSRTIGSISDLGPGPGFSMDRERGLSDSGSPAAMTSANAVLNDDGLSMSFARLGLADGRYVSAFKHEPLPPPQLYSRTHSNNSSDSSLFASRTGGATRPHPSSSSQMRGVPDHYAGQSLQMQAGLRYPPKPDKQMGSGSSTSGKPPAGLQHPAQSMGHRSTVSMGSAPQQFMHPNHQQQQQQQQQHHHPHHYHQQQQQQHYHQQQQQDHRGDADYQHLQQQQQQQQQQGYDQHLQATNSRWQPTFRFEPVDEEDYLLAASGAMPGNLRTVPPLVVPVGGQGMAPENADPDIDPRLFLPPNMLPLTPRSGRRQSASSAGMRGSGGRQVMPAGSGADRMPTGGDDDDGSSSVRSFSSSSASYLRPGGPAPLSRGATGPHSPGTSSPSFHPSPDDAFRHYPHRTSRPPAVAGGRSYTPTVADLDDIVDEPRSRAHSASIQMWGASSPLSSSHSGGAGSGVPEVVYGLDPADMDSRSRSLSAQEIADRESELSRSSNHGSGRSRVPEYAAGVRRQGGYAGAAGHAVQVPGDESRHQHPQARGSGASSSASSASHLHRAPSGPNYSPSSTWGDSGGVDFNPWGQGGLQPALSGAGMGVDFGVASGNVMLSGAAMVPSRPQSVNHLHHPSHAGVKTSGSGRLAPAGHDAAGMQDLDGGNWGSHGRSALGSPSSGDVREMDPWDQFSERNRSVSSPVPHVLHSPTLAQAESHRVMKQQDQDEY